MLQDNIYHLTCRQLKIQIFNKNWTTLNKLAHDLPLILEMFEIENVNMLQAHGYLSRFNIDTIRDKITFIRDGKQFFTFVNKQTQTFVIDDEFQSSEVFTFDDLKKALDNKYIYK